jgi:flagellar biosynthesis component FlhA
MENIIEVERKRIETLDKKIEKLQDKIVQKNKEYNALTGELQKLLDERYPERNAERVKEALYDAYQKSDKSLEDVIELIRNPDILDYI